MYHDKYQIMSKIKTSLVTKTGIRDKIYTVRNIQVMLDEDLAVLYRVKTKVLNQAVKRNQDRFPKRFCFQLTKIEYANLRSQIVTLKSKVGRKYLPFVFSEQGVAMLSTILKSDTAIRVSIQIMNAFVQMRKHVNTYFQLYQKVRDIGKAQILFEIKTDKRFDQVFNALSAGNVIPKQKIFFEEQVFDAHKFVSDIIRSAKKEIILIDNFVDDTVLSLFAKRKKNIEVVIYCKKVTRELSVDLKKFNLQYPPVKIEEFSLSHDRFLVVDRHDIYHFGASLKDLGKKWFAVSRFDNQAVAFLKKLENPALPSSSKTGVFKKHRTRESFYLTNLFIVFVTVFFGLLNSFSFVILPSINASFFALVHPFSCISRSIASILVLYVS